jgi:hypothetical protein
MEDMCMEGKNSAGNIKRGKMIRSLAIIVLAGAILVIILAVVVFPKMEGVFLRKGIEYAAEKTVATLPTVEGFNPIIHKHDPLEVTASFDAIHAVLLNDSLNTESLWDSTSAFMKIFKNCYDDQTIIPDEQTIIVDALKNLQRSILQEHFNEVKQPVLFLLSNTIDNLPASTSEVLGFDSIAIYNDDILLGMTGPLSLDLIVGYYNSIEHKSISQENAAKLMGIISDIERFQIKNELNGLTKLIYKTDEFNAFPNREQFQEDVDFIINKLRDREYDYASIKATLRSFIVFWYSQERAENFVGNSIEPLYDFLTYAKNNAQHNEQKLQTPSEKDTASE